MKRLKRLTALLLCLVLAAALFSCGNSDEAGYKSADRDAYYDNGDGWTDEETEVAPADPGDPAGDSAALKERKQIFRYELHLKTAAYDELLKKIRGEVKDLSGFVESMDQDQYGDYRSLTLVVRVPADKAEAFVDGVAGSAVVTSRGQSSEDVTLEYVDVETRLKNLESERQALTAMMEKAQTVEDLITIQTRLSDVQYEIESYTARRNKIDELVGLSTVSFRILEVAREEDVAAPDEGIWAQIGAGFMNNLRSLGEFFRDLFVLFVISIPYLIIPVTVILIVFFIIRHAVRKSRKQEQERRLALAQQAAQRQQMPPQQPKA